MHHAQSMPSDNKSRACIETMTPIATEQTRLTAQGKVAIVVMVETNVR